MRALLGALILTCAASVACAQFVDYQPIRKPKVGKKVGLTEEQFKVVRECLEKNAVSLLNNKSLTREAADILYDLQYDEAAWKKVEAYLKGINKVTLPEAKKPGMHLAQELYITCALLRPLTTTAPEVIRKAVPFVESIEEHYRNKYEAFKTWPPAFLQKCKIPDKKGADALNLLDKVDAARLEKTKAEHPTYLANSAIGEIEQLYCLALIFAQDPKCDQKLLAWIDDNEDPNIKSPKKNHVWSMGVDALISEAASGEMSKQRAQAIVAQLKEIIARRINAEKARDPKDRQEAFEYSYRWYKAVYLPDMHLDENSKTIGWRWEYTGYRLLIALKYADMVVNGIKEADKSPMVIKNPYKQNPNTWSKDKEYWDRLKTKREKIPPGYDGPPPY